MIDVDLYSIQVKNFVSHEIKDEKTTFPVTS